MADDDPVPRSPDVLRRPTLILNRSWVPIHVTTVRRAICLAYRDAARIICPTTMHPYTFPEWLAAGVSSFDRWIEGVGLRIAAPEVAQLASYNRVPSHRAPFTRRNLFARDGFRCQYCAERYRSDELTIDHVVPRSRGGETSWDNCVLSCVRCNARKGDRTPREAGMTLRSRPRSPRWSPYLGLPSRYHLETWAPFTGRAKTGS